MGLPGNIWKRRRTCGSNAGTCSALDSGDVVGDDADTAQALEESRQLAWYDNRIQDLERRLSGVRTSPKPCPPTRK